MDRNKFIDDLIAAGATDDEIAESLQLAEQRGELSVITAEPAATQTSEQKPRNLFGLPDAVERAVFPSTGVQATGERKEGILPALGQAGDALGLPVRAAGMLRGYKISDPQSNIFRPEIDKVKAAVSGGPDAEPPQTALGELGGNLKRGAVELTGSIAGDPFSYTGLARLAEKPLKAAGTRIEQSIIGKGNKSLVKRAGTSVEDVSENVLKYGAGGNLKQTVSKIGSIFEGLETQIDDALDAAIKANPTPVNIDDIIQNVGERVVQGNDPLFFGMSDQAEGAWKFWVDEFKRYGLDGDLDIKKLQEAKRLIGKKSFKKGSVPTPDTAAREDVADLIYLAMMDEIEKRVPAIGPLNRIYKELIPAKKMAESRIPVASGNDMLGLGSLVSGGAGGLAGALTGGALSPEAALGALGTAGLYNLSKSGKTAQALYNIGGAATKAPVFAGVGGAAYGATRVVDPEEEERQRKALEQMGRINWNGKGR